MSAHQWSYYRIIRMFMMKSYVLYSPTKVFQTGSSGIFNSMIYLSTSVWKVSTDKWMILFPFVSVFLQLAPREKRYWMVSSAPEVAASSSGVHWFLRVKDTVWQDCAHTQHHIYFCCWRNSNPRHHLVFLQRPILHIPQTCLPASFSLVIPVLFLNYYDL